VTRQGLSAVVAGCVCVLLSGRASAQPASSPGVDPAAQAKFRVVYEAPPGCPGREAFLAKVFRRTGRAWLASAADLSGTITISIRDAPDRSVAHMTLVDAVGRGAARIAYARDCQAAANAMALIAAMAIESAASSTEAPAQAATPKAPPGPPPAAPTVCRVCRLRAEAGVGGGVRWGIGPGAAWVASLPMMGFRWSNAGFSTRLAVSYWDTGTVAVPFGPSNIRMQFRLLSVHDELCPFEPTILGPITLPLCATAGFGELMVRPKEGDQGPGQLDAGPNDPRFWASAGIATRLRLSAGRLFAELGGGLDGTVNRSEWTVAGPSGGAVRRYAVEWVTGGLEAALGWQFP
jgi:hypothetical protein